MNAHVQESRVRDCMEHSLKIERETDLLSIMGQPQHTTKNTED